ncbi:HAMP domain-containing histidine kinase [Pararhizobium sp. BT-229]|uniref:sensor histidine kinase n=1 Tax=Pararhizobium sp. BT-229 TaxID=2986923 RepID=UPI0021F7EA2F|nr:HAMP domain-containing sensor histidine kinase [Pararhizobium sp. BT-229]MCV9962690.1 HAMP domain-containing histidine kinase [Pararhizobium sp. BT-229]
MTALSTARPFRPWPTTLGSRLFLIFLAGLIIANGLSFSVLFFERYVMVEAMLLTNLDKDVTTAVALLDRLPASERPDWVGQLDRRTYRYVLGPGLPGVPDVTGLGAEMADTITKAVGDRFAVTVQSIPGAGQRLQAHLTLSDGAPLTIDIYPTTMPLAKWLPYVLFAQLILLILCSWFAVRLAIRPLVNLADAANALDPNKSVARLDESGPREVAYAAIAFNAMRDRIARYLQERVQILAAISHDLQTPITRMKLRAEFAEESAEKEKLLKDLTEIERLVHEGVAYARSAHGNTEKPSRIDVDSFMESLVYDYQDMGKAVELSGKTGAAVVTRAHALRRILTNLIDNALKFGGTAEVRMEKDAKGAIAIEVLDRGPGIPAEHLESVLQPFFRVENSRNRETGGTGLGLAIALELSRAIGATLKLSNRTGGGLSAQISMS